MLTGGASKISQRGAPTFKGSTNPKGGINLLSSQISRKLHGNEENWMEKLGVIQYFNTHVKIQQPVTFLVKNWVAQTNPAPMSTTHLYREWFIITEARSD